MRDNPHMMQAPIAPDVMTPEQAAAYLQLNRETVYRYIRQGKLIASRFGRSYRIQRRNVDLLLRENSTRPDVTIREYDDEQIAAFLEADRLDDTARAVVGRFLGDTETPGVDAPSRTTR